MKSQYSFESRPRELAPALKRRFKANARGEGVPMLEARKPAAGKKRNGPR